MEEPKRYQVGDTVWVGSFTPLKALTRACSVCAGDLEVTLILGNGDRVRLPCDYCGKGFEAPTGVETIYEADSTPKQVTITSCHVDETASGDEIRYHAGHYVYDPENIFDTEEEALAHGEGMKAKWIEEQNTRAEYLKKDIKKNFAWNAGYHIREAKSLRSKIKYHEEKAVLCKERAKVVP